MSLENTLNLIEEAWSMSTKGLDRDSSGKIVSRREIKGLGRTGSSRADRLLFRLNEKAKAANTGIKNVYNSSSGYIRGKLDTAKTNLINTAYNVRGRQSPSQIQKRENIEGTPEYNRKKRNLLNPGKSTAVDAALKYKFPVPEDK